MYNRLFELRFKCCLISFPFWLSFHCLIFVWSEELQVKFYLLGCLITFNRGDHIQIFIEVNKRRIGTNFQRASEVVNTISACGSWVIALVFIYGSFKGYIFRRFSIKFYSVKIFVDVPDHIWIGEGVLHHHFTRSTPLCLNVDHNFLWCFLLSSNSFFNCHPVYFSCLSNGCNRKKHA